ncbi:GPI transamidase component PIG-T [Diorhabda sublineata]|uniref:GPI transamidase component PIG-T n=1 Tax=Diorhabda sublineata TaxID=1163346 RepID=UPI0024E07EEC|nr:GPI transamidase component PIG-T [Diorhabda sublineata]
MNLLIEIIFIFNFNLVLSYDGTVTEELLIKPLPSQQVYNYFQFSTKWDIDPDTETFRHSPLFPRPIGELIQRFEIQELHISLTSGLWRYENWGYPVEDAATGAEVWVWFRPTVIDVDKNWKLLANSLSGLLCASLNFIDSSNTVSPQFSFRPKGIVESTNQINNSFIRYASLPQEIVCTENLTPWKKLLPCDSKTGLASLLTSGYIHNTRYHSLGLHLRPICRNKNCESLSLELKQTVSLVYDYLILGTKNWSLRKLFGQGINKKCILVSKSEIYVDTTNQNVELEPNPDETITSIRGGQTTVLQKYQISDKFLNIYAKYPNDDVVSVNIPPPLYAHRYLSGFGQERGGIVTKIVNNHWGELDVVLMQNIPWFIPIYLHTLKVVANGNEIKPLELTYVPARQRQRPNYLEVLLRLPPRSSTTVVVDFDYVFLKWQEYPPDANLGFYIGSAIISCYLPVARNYTGVPQDGTFISDSFNASRSGYLVQVRTENIVITLPTPDFSMPYNVICLACTVVALAFGPMHNITTKKLVLKSKKTESLVEKAKKLLAKIKK